MSTRTSQGRSRRASAALIALGVGLTLPATAGAQDVGVRTESELGGYVADAQGAALSVLVFEPVVPLPVDPGKPHLQAEYAYTRSELSTGPQSRAVASTLWPGPTIGDGFATIAAFTGLPEQDYPIKADARYPDGPIDHAQEVTPGVGMQAVAYGLDVVAKAQNGESPSTDLADLGQFESESYATEIDGAIVTGVVSSASDVTLAGGAITIDSVVTELTATSDGVNASTSGSTTVTGLTIAGQGYAIDEDGLRPIADGEGEALAEFPLNEVLPPEAQETLGFQVELLDHVEEVDGNMASREAGGVRITTGFDTLLDTLPTAEVEAALLEALGPQAYYETVGPIFALGPRIEYVIANGAVSSRANLPLTFTFPPLPTVPTGPGLQNPAPTSTPPATPTSSPATASPRPSTAPSLPTPSLAEPQIASPTVPAPTVVAAPELEPVALPLGTGVSSGLALLGFALAGLGAFGLSRFSLLGLAGSCAQGAPTDVPNLKGD